MKNEKFQLEVYNYISNSNNIIIPLFEAKDYFKTYLNDVNHQEMLNAIDIQEKFDKFSGLKIGSVLEPNNNARNWE